MGGVVKQEVKLPNIASSKRQVRTDKRRTERNKGTRTHCKSEIIKAESLISSGKIEEAKAATAGALTTLDKAAIKGIIHTNNAARRKSRLVAKLNQAIAAGKPAEK